MTKADLIEEVSRVVEMTRKESEVIVEAIFDSIVRSLRTGDKIEIRGFGSFRTRQRQPRIGRNPKTGARVEVPAKKIPYFKPSKELKDVVNNSGAPGPAPALAARYRTGPQPLTAWIISGLPGDISTSPRRGSRRVCLLRRRPIRRRPRQLGGAPRRATISSSSTGFPTPAATSWWCRTCTSPACEELPEEALVEMMRLARRRGAAPARPLPPRRPEPGHEPRARAPARESPATCTCTCCRAGPATPIS